MNTHHHRRTARTSVVAARVAPVPGLAVAAGLLVAGFAIGGGGIEVMASAPCPIAANAPFAAL